MPWYSLNNLIAGANAARYGMFAHRELLTLSDITPDPEANGIFNEIRQFPWNQLQLQSEILNLDYYENNSGSKVASRYLHKVAEAVTDETTGEITYTVPSAALSKLGTLIIMRYRPKWERLWNEYAVQPWFDNVSLTDITEGAETGNETTTGNSKENSLDSKSRFDSTAGSYTDSSLGTNTGSTVRSGTISTANSGQDKDVNTESGARKTTVVHSGTITDNGDSTANASNFGFNTTSEDGVPVSKSTGTDNNKRTLDNTDTTTELPQKKDTREITHGLHVDQKFDNLSDMTTDSANQQMSGQRDEKKNRTETGNGSRVITTGTNVLRAGTTHTAKKFSGYDYRRQDRISQLLKMFENPNLFPFFQIVYGDIDEIMCLPIFK